MRTLCSATLISECLIVGLVGLVAFRTTDVPPGTLWAVCGVVMVLCVLLCGFVTRPGGVAMGWALQVGLVLSGFLVPMMFFLGACFAALWWASVHFGRRVDELKAAHAERAAGA